MFPESPEAPSPGEGPVPVLRAHTPGPTLHALLRERQDGDEAPRGYGGGAVWMPLTPPHGFPWTFLMMRQSKKLQKWRLTLHTQTSFWHLMLDADDW